MFGFLPLRVGQPQDTTITKRLPVSNLLQKLREYQTALEALVRVEEKLDRLLALEGEAKAISNDPTELEHYYRQIDRVNGKRLHSFRAVPIEPGQEGMPDITCLDCGVSLATCGATTESWYCD